MTELSLLLLLLLLLSRNNENVEGLDPHASLSLSNELHSQLDLLLRRQRRHHVEREGRADLLEWLPLHEHNDEEEEAGEGEYLKSLNGVANEKSNYLLDDFLRPTIPMKTEEEGERGSSFLLPFSSKSHLSKLPTPFHSPPSPPPSSYGSSSTQEQQNKKRMKKTGTTIAGCIACDGRALVLGADTRATDGSIVADKDCDKVHILASNVCCCGAGTSGDIDAIVKRIRYTFSLRGLIHQTQGNQGHRHLLSSSSSSPMLLLPLARISAITRFLRDILYDANGALGINLIMGGYDPYPQQQQQQQQLKLFAIHPHGSIDSVSFAALGSGGLAAMSVLESSYQGPNHTSLQQAKELILRAIRAGIKNDLGSGGSIQLCWISLDQNQQQQQGEGHFVRTVYPEEPLPSSPSKGDFVDVDDHHNNNSNTTTGGGGGGGVNGFGRTPYIIQSRKLLLIDEHTQNQRKTKWVDDILGL